MHASRWNSWTLALVLCAAAGGANAVEPEFCGTDCGGHASLSPNAGWNLLRSNQYVPSADRGAVGPCTEDGSQIDILIVYTPNALAGAGDVPTMQMAADDAIAELNSVFTASGIATTAVLVGLEETNFNESGSSSTHLNTLRDPDDGVMDEVHNLRNQLRADLVCLIVENGTVCGIANVGVEAGFAPRPDRAFSVVDRNCLGGSLFAFPHEIGHNLGLLHEVADNPCLLTGADPAAHGYVEPGDAFSTVMTTSGPAPRIGRFSDPAVLEGGLPTGVAGEANNAVIAAQSVIAVSRYRNRDQDSDGVCDAEQIALDGSLDCNGNGVLDQFDIDLDRDGQPDDCQIALDANLDLDLDGVPDAAEIPILRVDGAAAPGGLGASWLDAIDDLQVALALARASGDVSEIWIAQGTYTPGLFRAQSFDLVGGVALYGGFDGTELARDDHDPELNPTILSGDLAGDDDPDFINRSDNSVTVLHGFEQTGLCTLDGLTITGGYSVEHRHCVAAGGTAFGGGIFAIFCDVEINDCVFEANAARRGGGLFLPDVTSWQITNSDIIANRAIGEWQGADSGGAYLSGSQAPAEMTHCRVLGNISSGSTGGVFFIGGTHTVNNVLFSGNRMIFGNGAFTVRLTNNSLFNNLTIVNNQADDNWSVGGPNFDSTSTATLSNSILWGNKIRAVTGPVDMGENRQLQSSGTLTLENCIIQNWSGVLFAGVANNGDDPLLVDALGPDGMAGTVDDDARLSPGSPGIDSGNNAFVTPGVASDLDANPRFVDDLDTIDSGAGGAPLVDRGAYEYQVAGPVLCIGDANTDLIVNFADITSVLSNWLNDYSPGTGAGDANADGLVNFADITSVLSNWLAMCP